MIQVDYTEKGIGLHEKISNDGYSLWNIDGVWFADHSAVQEIIDNFVQFPPKTQDEINQEAREYLLGTDWYIIRNGETGEAIPQDILDNRAAARGRVVA